MKLTTPAAILLGFCAAGAMVSASILLSHRGGEPSSPVMSASASRPSASAAAPDRAAVQQEVARALEAQRGTLDKACWEPSLQKSAKPERVRYSLNFTIAANGTQITRGINELRADGAMPRPPAALAPGGVSRTDVTMCLSRSLEPVRVSPPGADVYVEVPFELP